jgi:hypothetical protein
LPAGSTKNEDIDQYYEIMNITGYKTNLTKMAVAIWNCSIIASTSPPDFMLDTSPPRADFTAVRWWARYHFSYKFLGFPHQKTLHHCTAWSEEQIGCLGR